MVFINLRLIYMCIVLMINRGISIRAVLILGNYIAFLMAGVNLVMHHCNLGTWINTLKICFLGSLLLFLGSMRKREREKCENE